MSTFRSRLRTRRVRAAICSLSARVGSILAVADVDADMDCGADTAEAAAPAKIEASRTVGSTRKLLARCFPFAPDKYAFLFRMGI